MHSLNRSRATIEPEVQTAIAKDYCKGKRGHGKTAIAKKYGVAEQTVVNIAKRAKLPSSEQNPPRGHKRRKLGTADVRKLTTYLDKHPGATNIKLSQVVGGKIAERTVSTYLLRANPPFKVKKFTDVEPEEFTEEWRIRGRAFTKAVKRIPLATRVYQDETGIWSNDAKRYGRGRVGKPMIRRKKRHGKKYTLHIWARQTNIVYWELRDKYANDIESVKVCKRAAKKLKEGDVVIWDRLGKSGRCKNPKAQHYNPECLKAIEAAGASRLFLPPKGKYWNPVELLNNDLKEHYIRPHYGKREIDMSRDVLRKLIKGYMDNVAPRVLRSFFAKRANGKHAEEMAKKECSANEVSIKHISFGGNMYQHCPWRLH